MTSNTSGKGAGSVSDVSATTQNTRKATLLRRLARRFCNRLAAEDPLLADIAAIEASQRFDKQWYLAQYPDVANSGMSPIEHYVRHGAMEKRNPCAHFNTLFYITEYPDVAKSGVNPYRHYLEYGINEGRKSIPIVNHNNVTGPLVSIIVPVYLVESYISACLESIAKQTYENIEIIVVDDGSPDRSYEIANAHAKSDSRIKILRRENGGLGAARNAGAVMAAGTYLGFVDSDDVLPPNAIARMVSSLQHSGSDFAVGAIRRIWHEEVMPAADWVNEVFAENKSNIRLNEFPAVLKDVFSTNKLFNSKFYLEHVSPFPEGIRYEDREPSARAFVYGTFDVLRDVVYYWRIREDGTSISQQKASIDDLHDRSIVQQRVSRIFAAANQATYETWLAKALGFDLRDYFEQVPRTDEEYFQRLRDGMLPLASQMTPRLWQKVRMIDRLPALAVLAGHRDDVGVAIGLREEYGYFVPSRIENGSAYLDRRYLEGMRTYPDDELLKLGEPDLLVVAHATSLWWRGTSLRLEGYAFLASVEFSDHGLVTARLVSRDRTPVELVLIRRDWARADRETKDAWNGHTGSGFVIEIDPLALDLDPDVTWRIEITVGCSGLRESRSAILRNADIRGILGTPTIAATAGPVRWMARFEPDAGFVLRCCTDHGVRVTAIRIEWDTVTIATNEPAARTLLLRCETLCGRMDVAGVATRDGETEFRFRLPELPSSDDREHVWHIHMGGEGGPRRLTFPGDGDALERAAPEYRRVRAAMDWDGTLRLMQTTWWAVADKLQVGPDFIKVDGRIDAPGVTFLSATLAGESQALEADEIELHADVQRFQVRIPFDPGITAVKRITPLMPSLTKAGKSHLPCADDGSPPRTLVQPTMLHGFSLRLSVAYGQERRERWLTVGTSLQHQLPTESVASRYRLAVTRTPRSAALWIRFRQPYREDERGRLAQRRLQAQTFNRQGRGNGARLRLEAAVLFESFGGTQVSDSALAICEEIIRRDMGLELYWTVADMSMSVPRGTKPLLIHSREWMLKLHHARYLVNNNCFPPYFRKADGQTYLQTWHGTPLRRIGYHGPRSGQSIAHRAAMRRESTYWDFLLAQNDFAADVLPEALGYHGRVLNLGYPRDDALTGSRATLRRRSARDHFGFGPNQYVVLYAPTWRDNLSGPRGYRRADYLDFDTIRRAFGIHARLLLRGHHNTAKNPATAAPGTIDATHYPNINDLLLTADLLITDYSSIMFDWVVTGKPIVFLTPDLDRYRSNTGGFYFKFEEIAPGPICYTVEQVRDVLRNLATTKEAYAERYAAFTKRFAPRDDGGAAARVVDVVWGIRDEHRPTG
jgi:CDP-glycerol glycerophosphotransferase